jgi:hypothetical protein
LIDVFSFGNVTPSCKALTFLLIYLLWECMNFKVHLDLIYGSVQAFGTGSFSIQIKGLQCGGKSGLRDLRWGLSG